ncbi:hypothetical protein IWX90DRAFT_420957 [Phyllosticta citrichinensis]|uniref:Uncharacterized protein n=1 Tax=Phyllosticta citrichinensis TaxID=1130410 RepID=A0ABR1Y673_9PEZI
MAGSTLHLLFKHKVLHPLRQRLLVAVFPLQGGCSLLLIMSQFTIFPLVPLRLTLVVRAPACVCASSCVYEISPGPLLRAALGTRSGSYFRRQHPCLVVFVQFEISPRLKAAKPGFRLRLGVLVARTHGIHHSLKHPSPSIGRCSLTAASAAP